MIRYQVAIQPEHRERLAHLPPNIKQKLRAGLRLLETDPLTGKSLEQELTGYRSYPIHPYRIVYRIDFSRKIVHLVIVAHRREVYDLLIQQISIVRDRLRRKRSYRRFAETASLLR